MKSFNGFWEKVVELSLEMALYYHEDGNNLENLKREILHTNMIVALKICCTEGFTMYKALNLLIQAIKSRFDQPGYKMYCCLQILLIKKAGDDIYSGELQKVIEVCISG